MRKDCSRRRPEKTKRVSRTPWRTATWLVVAVYPITLFRWIHWVGSNPTHQSPIKVSVRVTNPLFKSKNPSTHPNGFLADINPISEEIFPNAMIEIGFKEIRSRAPWPAEAGENGSNGSKIDAKLAFADREKGKPDSKIYNSPPETIRFQGMRNGYFCVDRESKGDAIVLNRIVTLKEDAGKD